MISDQLNDTLYSPLFQLFLVPPLYDRLTDDNLQTYVGLVTIRLPEKIIGPVLPTFKLLLGT